jgi:hypothetical protein
MAWTDTFPCSFCGREIPIYKRFGNGQFCSKAHEDGFVRQQNQLAVEVLHRTHDALKAYRPTTSSIEDILGLPAKAPVPVAAPIEVAPVAMFEILPEPAPAAAEERLPQLPDNWFEPPAVAAAVRAPEMRGESREFDKAASAMLPQRSVLATEQAAAWEGVQKLDNPARPTLTPAPPMDRAIFHFGDSAGKLHQTGFLSSLRRLWESLTARR